MIWFKFYAAWGEGIRELSDAEAGRFIKALCACAESEEIPALSGAEKVLYALASRQLKQDAERGARISAVRAEAGRAGGLSSSGKQMLAKESKTSNCLQKEAKQANDGNCSIKNKELRSKKKEKDNICADAQSRASGSGLSPDQTEYWQRAFGPNAGMAMAFWKASGILPVKSEFGRWQKELREFSEAGITVPQMEAAIAKIRAEGRITIGAPGSVFKTARDIAAGGSRSKQSGASGKPSVNEYQDIYTMLKAGASYD